MIIGLKSNKVKLVKYNPKWEEEFLIEKMKIWNLIRDKIIEIEHIGSTAIKGIHAKPIIDMAISIRKFEDGLECVKPLESIGYLYLGENGIPKRHYFRTNDEIVKFHLHFFLISSKEWENHILFRDYLNKNRNEAKRYDKLKLTLAKKYKTNRELYTEGKTSFCKEIIEKARNCLTSYNFP
ncbi:MAG: GrpB family protein [Spirochaetales bacterium]|nr:GrpB family protein [Spirochaetales bacterium]